MGNEINVMNLDFAKKFGLRIRKTKIGAQKIDGSKLDTFVIVIALFSIKNIEKKSRVFKELFLLADISMDIVLSIFFIILNNVKIDSVSCHIYYKMYTIAKVLLTTKQI